MHLISTNVCIWIQVVISEVMSTSGRQSLTSSAQFLTSRNTDDVLESSNKTVLRDDNVTAFKLLNDSVATEQSTTYIHIVGFPGANVSRGDSFSFEGGA